MPDSTWRFSSTSALTFSGLDAGLHTLEVRAKKNGPFTWSIPAQLTLSIGQPFWQRWWFFLILFISGSLLITVTTVGVNAFNKRRNLALQKLVDERTEELQLRNEELINLNLEKNNLIGIVAHDLKNPLSQILGFINLIKLTTAVNEETSNNLDLMKKTAERLNNLIMKILDVDAIESKKMNLIIEPLNLSELCITVTDRFTNDAANKGISIKKNISPGILGFADKNYFEQVLENLISNAIKFSPRNLSIYISLYENENHVVVVIKDEGPGISEEDKHKLFGKYQKLSARPTGGETSTGLGLSITKKFIEAMKGEIWCESETNKGASFFVRLPGVSKGETN